MIGLPGTILLKFYCLIRDGQLSSEHEAGAEDTFLRCHAIASR